jgi:WD40 repeat protein
MWAHERMHQHQIKVVTSCLQAYVSHLRIRGWFLVRNCNRRVPVTSCSYSPDGRLIAAGLLEGTIQIWDVKGSRTHRASWVALLEMLGHSYCAWA